MFGANPCPSGVVCGGEPQAPENHERRRDAGRERIVTEKVWRLTCCTLFERLSPLELSRLEARSFARTFPRKSPIYSPADDASSVLLLTRGRAKLCSLNSDGKQAILAFIEPGELFGELAVLGLRSREERAEAVETSTVLAIPGEEIEALMERHPDVSLGITKLIGLRRRRIERRLRHLLFHSTRDRLTHLLLELAEQYGVRTAAGVALKVKMSHQDLADVIGASRESVTLRLGELQAEGWLSIAKRTITIRDLDRLAASVETATPILAQHGGLALGRLPP
jgi:CRP-like cAMP-binding protein